MSKIAFPFLTLGPDSVDVDVWELEGPNGVLAPLQNYIEDWDYLRDLRLKRTLRISLEIAALHLGIPEEDLNLRVLLRVGTGPGTMPRIWIRSLTIDPCEDVGTFEIDELIEGAEISGRLRLETSILSFSRSEGAGLLSPGIDGAKVWNHQFDVLLEGSEPRFPMETVSFAQAFPGRAHASSLWYVHWSPGDIHRDFGGAVRLYVNSDREDVLERLTSSDPVLLQTIMADVMTQLITNVVAMDDAQSEVETAEEGSIAGCVSAWMQLAFPGETVADVRSKLERRPGDFHAAILAAAEIGGSGA